MFRIADDGTLEAAATGPEVSDSVTDHGGIWYGGQMHDGVMDYTESGPPVTPFNPDMANSWTTGPMPVGMILQGVCLVVNTAATSVTVLTPLPTGFRRWGKSYQHDVRG